MRARSILCSLLATFALACVGGCMTQWDLTPSKSPIKPFELKEQQTAIETTILRAPNWAESPFTFDELWQGVDEFDISTETRRNLAANGFRIGVFNGEPNTALKSLLYPDSLKIKNAFERSKQTSKEDQTAKAKDKPAPHSDIPLAGNLDSDTDASSQTTHADDLLPDLSGPQKPVSNMFYFHKNQFALIHSSSNHAVWPQFLIQRGKPLSGDTFYNAEGIFRATLSPSGANAAQLRLVPEIHHGEARSNFIADNGILRQDTNRPTKVFDLLALELNMKEGQTLMITEDPKLEGSMGHYFLGHRNGDDIQPKILLIRVIRSKYDEMFQANN